MPDPINPALEHTAFRLMYDENGLPLPGRFALQVKGTVFTVTNEPETSTQVARTVIEFSGDIQPPPDTDLLIKNANGEVFIKLDQDGLYFGATGGGEPLPIPVSASRTPRDTGLEAVLVGLGLIELI